MTLMGIHGIIIIERKNSTNTERINKMEIRVKDLITKTTPISYNHILVIDTKHDRHVTVYNTVSNHDVKILLERTESVDHFWVTDNEMFILI